MYLFKLLFLPLGAVFSASALLQIEQATSNNHGNHILAFPVKNDRSTPSPPSQLQFPHTGLVRHDQTEVTRSSQSTKRAKTLPSGWKSGFCVAHSPNRVLSAYSQSSTSMTPTSCIQICESLGYSYAGVEDSSECHCDNSFSNGPPTVAPRSECSMPCSGDPSQTCGAGHRLFWYSNSANAPYQTSTGPTTTAVTPTAWRYKCHSLGDTLEGVRCRKKCYRGHEAELDTEDVKSEARSAVDCNVVCPEGGDGVCGGGYQMKALGYVLGPTGGTTTGFPSTLTTFAAWTTGPCMIDRASPRLLSTQISSLTSNTRASCQSQCRDNGYRIAGVQYGRECWCGNTLSVGGGQTPASQVVSDSECTMTCPGGDDNACGNQWRMKVYGLGSVLSQYSLGRFTSTASVATSSSTNNAISARSDTLTSSSAATTASSSKTLPAKRVIAHHMVGNTYPYTLDTWSTDISLALSAGIDGFVLNVGSGGLGSWQRKQVKNAYDAAAGLSASGNTFGLFLSLDMT